MLADGGELDRFISSCFKRTPHFLTGWEPRRLLSLRAILGEATEAVTGQGFEVGKDMIICNDIPFARNLEGVHEQKPMH